MSLQGHFLVSDCRTEVPSVQYGDGTLVWCWNRPVCSCDESVSGSGARSWSFSQHCPVFGAPCTCCLIQCSCPILPLPLAGKACAGFSGVAAQSLIFFSLAQNIQCTAYSARQVPVIQRMGPHSTLKLLPRRCRMRTCKKYLLTGSL